MLRNSGEEKQTLSNTCALKKYVYFFRFFKYIYIYTTIQKFEVSKKCF